MRTAGFSNGRHLTFRSCAAAGVLALAALAAGCKKEAGPTAAPAGPGVFIGGTSKAIVEMVPTDVIVAVNGTAFTRADYDLMLSSVDKLYRLNNPNANPVALQLNKQRRARTLVREFLTKEVLTQEARRRGLSATPEQWERAKAGLARAAASKNVPVEALAESPDADLRLAYTVAQDNALILALREAEFGDRLKATDEDIAGVRQWIVRYNADCEATNRLVMARGKAICERIRAGEDFLELAPQVTEDEACFDGLWGEFMRAEIDDKAVRAAAFSLPVGAVSEPFDTEEGLVIIKVLERKGVDSPVATEEAVVKLGRILLKLAASVPPDKTDDAIRQEIEQARLREFQTPLFRELEARTRFEYPNGTNFFPQAKKESGAARGRRADGNASAP